MNIKRQKLISKTTYKVVNKRKKTKKLRGGMELPEPYVKYEPQYPLYYPLRKTRIGIRKDDKKIKLVIGHGVALPNQGEYQFSLDTGYNVIFVTEPLKFYIFGMTSENHEIILGNLLSKYNFDLSKVYNLSEYDKIRGDSNNSSIITKDYLHPEFKKYIKKYDEELRELQFNIMKEIEAQKTQYDFDTFQRKKFKHAILNASSNMSFNLHIGGINKKCNDVSINLSQNEDNIRTGNYFCGMLENIHDINSFPNNLTNKNENKFLSQFIKENGPGTYMVMCCRLNTSSNILTTEQEETMRSLSGQSEFFFNVPVVWKIHCQLEDCYNRTMRLDDPNFSLCKFCKKSYCEEHNKPTKHKCINKCCLCDDIDITKIMCFIKGCEERICSKHYAQHINTHVETEQTDTYLINLMAQTFHIIDSNLKKINEQKIQNFLDLQNRDKLNILYGELSEIYYKVDKMDILEDYDLLKKKGFIFLLYMNDICKIREEIEKLGITL